MTTSDDRDQTVELMRDQAIELMRDQKFTDALAIFKHLLSRDPKDWPLLYMAGQCSRFLGIIPDAINYLRAAAAFDPRDSSVYHALGIAHQLVDEFDEATKAFRKSLEIDPNNNFAYNSLALTQRKMGHFELALQNYDAAAKAMTRRIVSNMENARSNRLLPHRESRHNLWAEHATFGALYLCSQAGDVARMAWPTGELAEEEERTRRHEGLYWFDYTEDDQRVRLVLPNFFNTFREILAADSSYSLLMGNQSVVLVSLGEYAEAQRHLDEAEDFKVEE